MAAIPTDRTRRQGRPGFTNVFAGAAVNIVIHLSAFARGCRIRIRPTIANSSGGKYRSGVRYVAFLRGMNLGKRRLPMSKLRMLCEELGFEEVETFIASGNVIFSSKVALGDKLEGQISSHLEKALDYPVETFVRPMAEVVHIAGKTVFPDDDNGKIRVHVAFLKKKLPASIARGLQAVNTGYDEFRVAGREFYWMTRGPISESKVWTLPEVKQIRLPSCTMRNMTSIRKLVAKHA